MRKSKKSKRLLAVISVVTLLTTMLTCFAGCNKKKEPDYKRQHTYCEIFDSEGKYIQPDEGCFDKIGRIYTYVNYKYTGEPIKFTVDMIIRETGERLQNYGEILIGFFKFEENGHGYYSIGGGWQKENLNWPSEVGEYFVKITIDYTYVYINGKQYMKYEPFDIKLTLSIQEK